MTKLDFLKRNDAVIRTSIWVSLGCREITESTKYLSAGMVYKLNLKDSDLVSDLNSTYHDCLFFCSKDIVNGQKGYNFNWINMKSVPSDIEKKYPDKPVLREVSFSNADEVGNNIIIAPYIYLILPKKDFYEVLDSYKNSDNDPNELAIENLKNNLNNFVPFLSDKVQGNITPNLPKNQLIANSQVHISDKDYENCLKCLGYPFITEDDLEYSREDILNLAIKPALEEYFHWIPSIKISEYPVTGRVQEIEYPSEAYDVLGVNVQQRGTHGSGNITNTLLRYFDEAAYGSFNYSGMTGIYRGTRAPHTITTGPENYITNRALTQATVNLNTRVHFDKFIKENGQKAIRVYSNKLGTFNIHWAVRSLDFDDIEYQQRQNVFKYCQAEIKELFGNLRRQAKADIPGVIDYSSWITEAEEAKKEVVADWKQLVKASSIIRGSL